MVKNRPAYAIIIGPTQREQTILMLLNRENGNSENCNKQFGNKEELKAYLDGLSTYDRFKRFAIDFRKSEKYKMKYEEIEKDGENISTKIFKTQPNSL